ASVLSRICWAVILGTLRISTSSPADSWFTRLLSEETFERFRIRGAGAASSPSESVVSLLFLIGKPSIHGRMRVGKAGTQVLSLPALARATDHRFPRFLIA